MSSKFLNIVFIAFLLLTPFAGHVVMMTAMSGMAIAAVASAQSAEQKIDQLPALTSTLVLGLITSGMLSLILLYHTR